LVKQYQESPLHFLQGELNPAKGWYTVGRFS
jgi:hypothetical protein